MFLFSCHTILSWFICGRIPSLRKIKTYNYFYALPTSTSIRGVLSSLADLTTTLSAPAPTRSRWSSFHELIASSASCDPQFRALWCAAMFCANIIILDIVIVLSSTSPHIQAATLCFQLIHQCCASQNTQISLTATLSYQLYCWCGTVY
jgi:hypothetical protein